MLEALLLEKTILRKVGMKVLAIESRWVSVLMLRIFWQIADASCDLLSFLDFESKDLSISTREDGTANLIAVNSKFFMILLSRPKLKDLSRASITFFILAMNFS